MLRRLFAFLPILATGTAMLYRAGYFWWRGVGGPPPAVPPWMPWLFALGGSVVLVAGLARIFNLASAKGPWALFAAPSVAGCYMTYSSWLLVNREPWQWGGIVGEFALIPILIAWAWGNQPTKDLKA